MHSRNLLFILLLISQVSMHAHHKIIYLISPPRSLSVAFTRMMQARGDFKIFHEPSQKAFNSIHYPHYTHWYRDDASNTYMESKAQILLAAKNYPIFVKEMSFAIDEFITKDLELLNDPNVYFVFLLRKPHATTISFYNRSKCVINNLAHAIGYKSCLDIYHALSTISEKKPLILSTEDLYNDPSNTIQKFCDYCDIPFMPEALEWNDLGNNFSGVEEWHETKFQDTTQHWHGDAIHSTGFHKPHEYEVDEQGNPTFEEIAQEYRDEYIKAYEYNKPFYELLSAEAL